MTRDDVTKQFSINERGIIQTPGMFEGEMLYVPHFWEAFLDGLADRDNGRILGFDITAEDRKEFPELKGKRTVKLFQRDDGFVCEA